MKVLYFSLALLITLGHCEFNKQEERLVTKAILELIRKYFIHNSPKIDFLFLGGSETEGSGIMKNLINEIRGEIATRVISNAEIFIKKQIKLTASTIIIMGGGDESYYKLNQLSLVDEEGNYWKHLLYAPGVTYDSVDMFFGANSQMSELGVLYNYDGSSIELSSNFRFSPNNCHEDNFQTVNRFTAHNMRWESDQFYPKKYQNFHKCTIEVRFYRGRTNPISIKIFDSLAKDLNFTLKRIEINDTEYATLDRANTMVEHLSFQHDDSPSTTKSSALYFDSLTLVVPPGEPLTDFEKILAIFDSETWISIGITFVIALLAIRIISLMSLTVRNFIYGRKITTPTLNLFDIFLNGGQNREPGRNFARYLLIMFITWSMIFRTCFQSKMFENMQNDMRHQYVKTIDELIEKNFSLISRGSYDDHFIRTFNTGLTNVVHIPVNSLEDKFVTEPGNKFTFMTFRMHYWANMKIKLQTELPSTHLLEENIATMPIVLVLPRFLPYTETFKEKIDQLIASGLVRRWSDELWSIDKPINQAEDIGPQVLTVPILLKGFLAFVLCLLFALMVFVGEFLTRAVSRFRSGNIA